MSKDDPSLEARDNGPFVARGVTSIERTDGVHVEAKPVMTLCRCGASRAKPFCDGTHIEIGFDSSRGTPAGRDRVIAYEGVEATVTFNPMLCCHAAECGRQGKSVFDATKKPWIQPDNGTVAEIEAVIAACPSGALQMARAGGDPDHRVTERPQVTVQKDGPLWVQGIAPPAPLDAEGATPRKYVLCRCGLSGNKPFCDGSHRDRGWKDAADSG